MLSNIYDVGLRRDYWNSFELREAAVNANDYGATPRNKRQASENFYRETTMNILVTGGAGYIGSTLVPLLLSDGHRVRVLDKLLHDGESLLGVWSHPNFEFVPGDICDRAQVQ